MWARPALLFFVAVFLYLGFARFYFAQGLRLSQHGAYAGFDIIFDSDLPRVVDDLTNPQGDHYRTDVHPLFVILFNPIGVWLTKQTGSDLMASLKLTTVFGGLCPALLFVYLLLIGLDLLESVLLSLIYGFTATQLVWSCVPDTYVFAAVSLLLAHILFALALRGHPSAYALLPVGGLAALSITVTNYAQALILFMGAAVLLGRTGRTVEAKVLQPAAWTIIAIAVSITLAIGLSAKQKAMYPSSTEFYTADAYTDEVTYINREVWKAPFNALQTLTLNLGAFSFIGPTPEIVPLPFQPYPGIAFTNSCFRKYGVGQWMALLIWLAAFVHGVLAGWKRHRLLLGVLGGCLGFNLALHSIYGTRFAFLYSAHVTFLLVGIAGIGFLRLRALGRPWRYAGLGGLAGLLMIEAYYNLRFMHELGALLQSLS